MESSDPDALARTELGSSQPTPETVPTARVAMPDALNIPGYHITGVIGQGGMGTVYAAEQEAPRRRVAIKVLQSRSESALARFAAEAEIMARLDHPGIARVLEAGEADGHPFLVMEHVDGMTLDRFAKELSRHAKLELFAALCDAVHHAHLKGVIHRDLKPSNVMVKSDGRVVVLDFGIARLAEKKSISDTHAGDLIGTPLYMSPEQALLHADEVDARTDVYTLGVILYELLSGELPYGGRDVQLAVITHMITTDPPVSLATRDAALRGDLDAITRKTLEKEPADRYQSVAALGDDIRRHLTGLAVTVRAPRVHERARRFIKRRPIVAATAFGGILAAIAFAVIVTYLWRAASRARNALEARTNQLVLRQARAVVARDPTEAVAWLSQLTPRGVDPGVAWSIMNEAMARGVSSDVLRGHLDEVHWTEPYDGGFVSGAYDGTVDLWEPNRRLLFKAKHGRIHTARPSPGAKEFAIGADDGALTVVAHDGRVLAELSGHEGDVQHMAWTPDGAWLVTGDDHGNVFAWPHARPPGRRLVRSGVAIGSIGVSATGRTAVASDHDGNVWQWDLATGSAAHVQLPGGGVTDTWTDDAHVVTADASGTVRWLSRQTLPDGGQALAIDHATATGLNAKRSAFAPGAAFVAVGGIGGALLKVEGDQTTRLATFHAEVRAVAVADDARHIAAGADDGSLVVIDAETLQRTVLHGHTGRIRHVAFSDGGRVLLSADSDGVVRRWELSKIPATVIDSGGAAAEQLAVSSDGTFAAWVDEAGTVATWSFGERRLTVLGTITGRATALAISHDTVITGTAEGDVTWWTPQPQHHPIGSIVKMLAAAGDVVAVATSAGPIVMFTSKGEEMPPLAGNPGGTEAVALDAAGTIAVSGGQDRSARVWRVRGGAQLAELPGLSGDTHVVAITDSLVVAGSNGGTVYAWPRHGEAIDAAGRILVTRHVGAVTALAATATEIASAGRDSVLARAHVKGTAIEPALTTTLPNAANTVGIDDDGTVRAVTRTGIGVRWSRGGDPVIEVDHGLTTAVRVAATSRWLEAFDDGTYVLTDVQPRTFDELQRAVAAATTFHLLSSGAR